MGRRTNQNCEYTKTLIPTYYLISILKKIIKRLTEASGRWITLLQKSLTRNSSIWCWNNFLKVFKDVTEAPKTTQATAIVLGFPLGLNIKIL